MFSALVFQREKKLYENGAKKQSPKFYQDYYVKIQVGIDKEASAGPVQMLIMLG